MKLSVRHLVVGVVMVAAAALATAIAPSRLSTENGSQLDLEAAIPKTFGVWKMAPEAAVPQVDLAARAGRDLSEVIYSQSLLRTYRKASGELVMLALAYGTRQNSELQVHRPEVCYVAQGFDIVRRRQSSLPLSAARLPLTLLETRNQLRVEPVTYWMRIGDEIVTGAFDSKLAIVKAGLLGVIPDGILVRASTIVKDDNGVAQAFALQSEFLAEMLAALTPELRALLLGKVLAPAADSPPAAG
jgi:EpsI family protein